MKKNQAILDLLHKVQPNQIVIFVNSVLRCMSLYECLTEQQLSAVTIYNEMSTEERFVHLQLRIK